MVLTSSANAANLCYPPMAAEETSVRVVLVDDSPGDVRWFKITLGEIGLEQVEVKAMETAIEAIEYFRSHPPPDLIVSDWRLPVLTFEEFMQSLRAIPSYESVPIVVLTGAADLIRPGVLALGAICCLEKPVPADRLREILRGIAVSAAGNS